MTALVGGNAQRLVKSVVGQRVGVDRGGLNPLPAGGGGVTNYWLNRARKTGGTFSFWESPTAQPDASGTYYPGGDWGDVVEVVGIRTWQA